MRTTADAHLDRVVEAIQNYLSGHPGAADGELGITQWWLRGLQQDVSVDVVRDALTRLQQLGVVEALEVAGVGRLWRALPSGLGSGQASDD